MNSVESWVKFTLWSIAFFLVVWGAATIGLMGYSCFRMVKQEQKLREFQDLREIEERKREEDEKAAEDKPKYAYDALAMNSV